MSALNIELGKEFRALVLKELRALATWPEYMATQGLRSNRLRSHETRAACVALGYDLAGAWARFQAGPDPQAIADNAAHDADIEAAIAAVIPAPAIAAKGDEAPPALAPKAPRLKSKAQGSAGASDEAPVSYEGRDVAQVIAETLAPVAPHMTPHLAALVPGLLAPLVRAATAGPRVIRQQVMAGASIPPAIAVQSRSPVHAVFDIKPRTFSGAGKWKGPLQANIPVCDYLDAPVIDPDYIWNPKVLAFMSACDLQGLNLWIYGPAGTGKTESAEQYAARTRRPFFRLPLTRNTEEVDLKGQLLPKGGATEWRDGVLIQAIRTPYAIILIDEPSLLRPGALAVFQTMLDTRRLRLSTGEQVEVAEGVFIIAADNTAGAGDDTGRYLETAPLNAAFMNRFALKLAYDYLPSAQEALMVARRANVPLEAAKLLVAFSDLTKGKAKSTELTMAVTPRQLIGWARGVKAGLPSIDCFEAAVINGAVAEDREVLLMLAATSLVSDHARIDGLIAGNWAPPAEGPAAPAPSPVGATFADDQL